MMNMMIVVLASAVGLGACTDVPVGIDENLDEGVERIQLVMNSQIVAEFDGSSWSGDIDVTEGANTSRIGVRLIDHDGLIVLPPSGVSLTVAVTNEAVVRWVPGSAGDFGGQLRGVSPGTTQAVFRLMRGTQVEYATGPLSVDVVTP